jgi:homoserine/homoserine lactone efflux protein
MTFDDWAIFMAVWVLASLPLGPNALNCISAFAAQGLGAGLWSVAGVTLAAMMHMSLALTGLAAFMNANPVLFEVIRWLGVGYLAWMGLSMFRSAKDTRITGTSAGAKPWHLVRKAILISLSNPKSIFVWLAVFSQFIATKEPLAPQLLILAPSALAVTIAVYAAYATLGLGVGRVLAGRRKVWFDRITGSTYLAFAFGLAASDLRRG